ncbi:MAG: tetratricopeptide repeat protein [Crocinitomicaceae bacterium]
MKNVLIISFILSALLASCVSYDELINQGKEEYDNGNAEEAQLSFEKALKKDSTRPDAYYGLGFLLAEKCRAKQTGCEYGVNYFTQVIRIDSNYRHAFYNRANCFMELGQYKEALHDLNTPASINKQDADYLGNRSICYLNVGDTLNALTSYKEAVKLNFGKRSEYMDLIFQEYSSRNEDRLKK